MNNTTSVLRCWSSNLCGIFRYSYWLLCNLFGKYTYHNFTVRISHNCDETLLENFILVENFRVCDRLEILKLPV